MFSPEEDNIYLHVPADSDDDGGESYRMEEIITSRQARTLWWLAWVACHAIVPPCMTLARGFVFGSPQTATSQKKKKLVYVYELVPHARLFSPCAVFHIRGLMQLYKRRAQAHSERYEPCGRNTNSKLEVEERLFAGARLLILSVILLKPPGVSVLRLPSCVMLSSFLLCAAVCESQSTALG